MLIIFPTMTRTYLVLVLTALLCAPSPAQAQPVTLEFGPRGGYSISEQASFVGADFRVDEASLPFVYHLGFDYYLEAVEGEQDAPNWQFDVNSYIPFLVYSPTITLQLGGGFSVQRTVPSTGAETDWGFNGTAGFVLNPTGTFQPFVRARATLAQGSTFDAMGGLLIVLRR
jgi:hypothetical protein